MKYYIIAGEASGDLHGSSLIRELIRLDPEALIRAWGGEKMMAAGATLVKHYRDLAFMGFVEVAKNLGEIIKNIQFCKQDITSSVPDVIILIDYPGFNLRIAKWAKEKGFKICYFISPQIWAWNQKRVHKIKKSVDQMFVILPFEKEFYRKFGMDVNYVGHPLIDIIPIQKMKLIAEANKLIAVLPGSRKQEIKHILPSLCPLFQAYPKMQFRIAAAPNIPVSFYTKHLGQLFDHVQVVDGQTYQLLSKADAAITASGTATLETALYNVPQIVCYKGNPLSYRIAKMLIKVSYISLVNLVVDKPLVRELIQNDLNEQNLIDAFNSLFDRLEREKILSGYSELRNKLGQGGAAKRTAQCIVHAFASS
jgi:lipid-A-disaccharide synthase